MDDLTQVMEELRQIRTRVDEVHEDVTTIKAWRVEHRLDNYGKRIGKLETWSARLIGAYTAAAVVAGIGFQILLKAIGL